MKQTTFTFLLFLFCAAGLLSCRKDKIQLTIKQYDQNQIQNYISSHGLTGMQRDTVGGDTTGIYYQIIHAGTGAQMFNPTKVGFVFSLTTFDGKYASVDTIANHYEDYVGHVLANKLPLGLQTALVNDLKYQGGIMRLLIPSHLAYGVDGYHSGSTQVAGAFIAGNQCLDYYVHVMGTTPTDNQATYDDQVIQNYLKANSYTGYTKTASGLYYKVLTPATGSDPITINSTITTTYTGQLLNKTIFDSTSNGTVIATLNIADFATPGNAEGLENYASVGTKISLIMPSALGYGTTAQTAIPPNSCLRFTWAIQTVTP